MRKAASRTRDEKLLAAVRDRPVLYDQSMHVFKDFGAKNAAWKEVAAVVVGAQDKQSGRYFFFLHRDNHFPPLSVFLQIFIFSSA